MTSYLDTRLGELDQAKRKAQQQMAEAQVVHERAEGGRLMLLQLQKDLANADAMVTFCVLLYQRSVPTNTASGPSSLQVIDNTIRGASAAA